MYFSCLCIWIYYYGWDNKFIYQTGFWFASHSVLAVLMNVMFYMIRLYRYVLTAKRKED